MVEVMQALNGERQYAPDAKSHNSERKQPRHYQPVLVFSCLHRLIDHQSKQDQLENHGKDEGLASDTPAKTKEQPKKARI